MDRAAVSNLQQPCAGGVIEVAGQLDGDGNMVNLRAVRFNSGGIGGVDLGMVKAHGGAAQGLARDQLLFQHHAGRHAPPDAARMAGMG